jgi:hypothetical protein
MNYLVYGATKPTEQDMKTPNTLGYLMDNSKDFADDMLDALTLNDILTDELKQNKFLMHIGTDTTISNLGDKLANLSIQDILGVDMYEWAWFNPNNGYACVPEGTAGAVKCMAIKTGSGNYDYIAVQAHEDTQTVGSTQYITYYALNDSTKKVLVAGNKMASPLTGVWKYLLTEKNVVIGGVSGDREISCDIMSLASVSNNLTENIQATTLNQLKESCFSSLISYSSSTKSLRVKFTPSAFVVTVVESNQPPVMEMQSFAKLATFLQISRTKLTTTLTQKKYSGFLLSPVQREIAVKLLESICMGIP